ncbi:diguanylate cyclase [Hyphomicrobium sp.]|uniref:GGDEF domain-containing response regulator n=1 Tax=Hyphomicrobium sp. TaxID=82 RepID=UPI0025BECDE3|nr:diguanylate cyclase [Hyphomicrobium sp.]MCC7253239.1 diguanylate cyclase [Hyphomicrobium sp.]
MHIAIVDPSRVVQQKLAAELEAAGCYVDCFSASDLVLQYVEATRTVDVILTSLELEPIPGLELCWKLRTLAGETRPLHIIVMSSNTSERALAEALDCGADDFVVKPVRREELMARLRAANRMITLQRQLVEQAETDYLTGVLNRRAFLSTMEAKRRELDASESLSVCLMDIDRFKSVNDTYGHDVGDVVITAVARIAGEEAPIVARLGGEEFALAFPVLAPEEAAHWCEVIRAAIATHVFQSGTDTFGITCSFGVADWTLGEPLGTALKRADRALMVAKTNGRNRVEVTPSTVLAA